MMMASAFSARKLLLRDWRGGELGILLAAVVLAVGVIVGINAFVSSLQSSLELQSRQFLAADRVVSSTRALPSAWREQAKSNDISTATTMTFASMTVTDDDVMHLASVKAVSANYPLRGVLRFSTEPFGVIEETRRIPESGEVWLAPRLFALLGVSTGDSLWVGEARLVVTGAIRGEPDGSSGMFVYGPRLMMNTHDIPATGVIQPGSRVSYRLLLRGSENSLAGFEDLIRPQLQQGQRFLDLDDSQPRISRTLDRARGFLLLAGSLAVVLAAAAIALAARRFSERHTDYVAILKSLGASSGQISRLYGSSLLIMGVLSTLLGALLGFAIQALFLAVLADQLGVSPASIGFEPFAIGAVTALVCLGCFAWPPLRRLSTVPPLRVLRRDVGVQQAQRPADYLLGGGGVVALMGWYSADLALTAGVVAGLLVTVGLGFVLARGLLRASRYLGGAAGSTWRLAMAGLVRRRNANALQMVIFGIAIMLMLVLVMIRGSLVNQWQAQLPPGTPNHFLINIAPEQRQSIASFFAERGLRTERQYPMTRGRVVAVNGELLASADNQQLERRQREANFTYAAELPEANDIIAGEWWSDSPSGPEVSVEEGFAERIGAALGDTLTLRVGADEFTARVSSVRRSDWQSMKPNFFLIFTPAVLDDFPKMYMTSFYLPRDQKPVLNELVRRFPTVTLIELDSVIDEIRRIVDRVGQAVGIVLAIILVAGALVLIAGVQASVDVRLHESALLRALGARRGVLLGALGIEFGTLGACAGLLAVVGAEIAAWALQTLALDLVYQPTVWLWPLGLLTGMVIIGGLGTFSCRRAVTVPPLVVLRDG